MDVLSHPVTSSHLGLTTPCRPHYQLLTAPASGHSFASLCNTSSSDFLLHNQIKHQLTYCLLDMIQLARKMRVALPTDSARLANNSQLVAASAADGTQKAPPGGPFPRRYSKVQEDETDDSFDTDQVLQRFTASMGCRQYQKLTSTGATAAPLATSLSKCLSSSDIAKLAAHGARQPAGAMPPTPTQPTEPSQGLVSRYLGRRGSTGSVLSRVAPEGLFTPKKPTDTLEADSGALVPASAAALSHRRMSCDVTDSSSTSTSSSGFGILSKTRQFGAWLTKATEGGEKVEVSRPDLNVVAPTSF